MKTFTINSDIDGKFNVYDVYAQKEQLVNNIAQEAFRAMTQTYIDMIIEEKLDNRVAIIEKLQGVHESAVDYMDVVMNDLHKMVKETMKKSSLEFSVRGIEYDNDELCNVDVLIKMEKNLLTSSSTLV